MVIDRPLCDLQHCKYWFDSNCIAKPIVHERCPYKIMCDDVDKLGYIYITK